MTCRWLLAASAALGVTASVWGREAALRYYDDFYKTIGDPSAIKREILRVWGNRS